MSKKKIKIGVENFRNYIEGGNYYVDKTEFIREMILDHDVVNLITRPRRFGKSLGISMLRYFFEIDQTKENEKLFRGLKIMEYPEYSEHLGKYPVIALSFKGAKRLSFEQSIRYLCSQISDEFIRHIDAVDVYRYRREQIEAILSNSCDMEYYTDAIFLLSKILFDFYNMPVIILIDEYDVPLEHAFFNNYYEKMLDFIRALFESALKTNDVLEFAVLTGCLRISKESVFTGLNNFTTFSILQNRYSGYFGFTESEVWDMLRYYELPDSLFQEIHDWYNGYSFGDSAIYNPWSVLQTVKAAAGKEAHYLMPYWSNTSSNNIVRSLIEQADISVKSEIEQLVAGGMIEKPIHEDITYVDIYRSADNLWNFLFFTGYLSQEKSRIDGENHYVTMSIPNAEVKYIYHNTILNWFRDEIKTKDLSEMYQAMLAGDTEVFQTGLASLLSESISFMDSREAFYHGFLLGILGNMNDYLVKSNRESGNGRLDIIVRSLDVTIQPVILELKVSDTFKGMEAAAEKALWQIEEKQYDNWLPAEGYTQVLHYGISFFKKQCLVKVVKKKLI